MQVVNKQKSLYSLSHGRVSAHFLVLSEHFSRVRTKEKSQIDSWIGAAIGMYTHLYTHIVVSH